MKKQTTLTCLLASILLLAAGVARAQVSPPALDEASWSHEEALATGKIRRGAGLAVTGLAAVVPSAIWIDRAFDNPHKFAALGAGATLLTVSMTLHGFNSVGFGLEQRGAARRFAAAHRDDPGTVDTEEQEAFLLYSRRKSAAKMVVFGGVLTAESVILLANGVALSAIKHGGGDIGGAKLWPSYVFGGALLTIGIGIIAVASDRYRKLKKPEDERGLTADEISFAPWFDFDETTRASSFGIGGQIRF